MNITTPEKLYGELWRRLYLCTLIVIVMVAVMTARLAYLPTSSGSSPMQMIELRGWRLGLLLTFQSAPLLWARLVYKGYKRKRISIPLYQTMSLLRVPIATWAGGCLVAAIALWPKLNV